MKNPGKINNMEQDKNWLQKGLEESHREVQSWPDWKKDSITVEKPQVSAKTK